MAVEGVERRHIPLVSPVEVATPREDAALLRRRRRNRLSRLVVGLRALPEDVVFLQALQEGGATLAMFLHL